MGLLNALERVLVPSRKLKRVDLKEIFCSRTDDGYLKKFRTTVVGTELSNPDGSERQVALGKIKVGEKVRLIWDGGDEKGKQKNIVYTLRSGRTQELFMPDCFGRLNEKTALDIIRWLTRENVVTSARVAKLTGGTRKRPKLGCVLELTSYPAPATPSGGESE